LDLSSKSALAASRERLHIDGMATSPGKIILKPTPLKVGAEWQIAAQHPSGQIEMICGFKSEIEANEWIKSGSKAWLKKRGNVDG